MERSIYSYAGFAGSLKETGLGGSGDEGRLELDGGSGSFMGLRDPTELEGDFIVFATDYNTAHLRSKKAALGREAAHRIPHILSLWELSTGPLRNSEFKGEEDLVFELILLDGLKKGKVRLIDSH